MTKRKNETASAAKLTAGSAENIIEDRAPAIDGLDIDVADGLQQPDLADDRNAIANIFTGFQAAFVSERNFTDPNTGELKVTNDRMRFLRIIANNFVDQLNYALKSQLVECKRRDSHVAKVSDDRRGDEDNSVIANAEAWADREFDKFDQLKAMRDAALIEYATLLETEYQTPEQRKAGNAPASRGRAASLTI